MGLFRKRERVQFIAEEDVLAAIEEGDLDWAAEVYGGELSAAEAEALELEFGRAAINVVAYLKGMDLNARATKYEMWLQVNAREISRSEFWFRYRPITDPAAGNAWLADALSAVEEGLDRYPGSGNPESPLPPADEMIAEARQLVDDGWEAICTLVGAKSDRSLDVDGREGQFLQSFFGDPSEYLERHDLDAA